MAIIIKLTDAYYKEFHKRKDTAFDNDEAIEIYEGTQQLKQNWPSCLNNRLTPPDVVKAKKGGNDLYYLRFNFSPPSNIKFRICFGVRQMDSGDVEIVGLTCRTKQELSGGSKTGTDAWNDHIATVGKGRWNLYRKGKIASWEIYKDEEA